MMTDHERAAMEKAADELGFSMPAFERAWKAARAYEPPKVCEARTVIAAWRCILHDGHDGDHRAEYSTDCYIGWPRT